MSVAMTTDAVIERRKTVTRRKGWWLDKNGRRLLHVGDTLTLCRKVQGRLRIPMGDGSVWVAPIERLAEVEVTSVEREHLSNLTEFPEYGRNEVVREGFPGMDPARFILDYFVDAQGMDPDDLVTRVEWRYICGSGFCECGGCVL
jgi:hypothetical protein